MNFKKLISGRNNIDNFVELFMAKISREIRTMYVTALKDVVAHLETLCEPDGDEDFEPFVDSPLRTCPPCEVIVASPTEGKEVEVEEVSDVHAPPPRRFPRVRQRGRDEPRAPPQVIIPAPPHNLGRMGAPRLQMLRPNPPRSPPLLRQNLQLRIVPLDELPQRNDIGIQNDLNGPLRVNQFVNLFRRRQRDLGGQAGDQVAPP